MRFVVVTEEDGAFTFVAPWGETMVARPGDGGEMPGYNSFMDHDPANDVTLVVWTSLTLSLDGKATANTPMVKILDQIYTVSPLQKAK